MDWQLTNELAWIYAARGLKAYVVEQLLGAGFPAKRAAIQSDSDLDSPLHADAAPGIDRSLFGLDPMSA
jgi:hypothetical protein